MTRGAVHPGAGSVGTRDCPEGEQAETERTPGKEESRSAGEEDEWAVGSERGCGDGDEGNPGQLSHEREGDAPTESRCADHPMRGSREG